MKVRELIELLGQLPPDLDIYSHGHPREHPFVMYPFVGTRDHSPLGDVDPPQQVVWL